MYQYNTSSWQLNMFTDSMYYPSSIVLLYFKTQWPYDVWKFIPELPIMLQKCTENNIILEKNYISLDQLIN